MPQIQTVVADISMADKPYDIGKQAAQVVYDGMANQQPLRSTEDFRMLVNGFAVRVAAITGKNLALTYPGKDRDIARSEFLLSLGQMLTATAADMLADATARASGRVN